MIKSDCWLVLRTYLYDVEWGPNCISYT